MPVSEHVGFSAHHSVVKVPAVNIPDGPDQISYTKWGTTERLRDILYHGLPRPGLEAKINRWRIRNQRNLWRGLLPVLFARVFRQHRIYGSLFLDIQRSDGTIERYGLASLQLVTTAGVDYITNIWGAASGFALTSIKYHGIGTSATAAAIGDTALGAETTSLLSPTNTRATGALTASSHNIVQSVGTVTVSGSVACVEAGLFSYVGTGTSPSVGSGNVLFDHFVFSAVNLAASDAITTTIQITLPPGS